MSLHMNIECMVRIYVHRVNRNAGASKMYVLSVIFHFHNFMLYSINNILIFIKN